MRKNYTQRGLLLGAIISSLAATWVYAEGELNLDDIRREFKRSAVNGSAPAGFEAVDVEQNSVTEAGRKLAEDEERLLQQLNSKGGKAASLGIDDGFGPAQGLQAVSGDDAGAPVKEPTTTSVETRFLDAGEVAAQAPTIENAAEVVAARVAAQDQTLNEAPPIEEPVIAPKPASKAPAKAESKTKTAALRRAAMASEDGANGEEQSFAELQDLIKRHGVIKADLKRQTDASVKLRKKNDDLSDQLAKSEARVKSLEQELTEARNRLIISETEVERLSGLMLTTVKSAQSLSRLNNAAGSDVGSSPKAQLTAVSNRRPTASQPAEDMPVATVVVEKANLRTGPGSEHSPLMSVTQGTRLLVEVRRGEWYRVISPSGTRAWVSSDVVAFGSSAQSSPTKTMKVKAYDASIEH